MPAPHTTAAATASAEAATAMTSSKGACSNHLLSAPGRFPPPQLRPEDVDDEDSRQAAAASAEKYNSSPSSSGGLVSAAALAAIADVDSVGEASGDADAVAELVAGLGGERLKTIPCSFLYDGPGSALYDAITELEAYYPYNAEVELLDSKSEDIAAAVPRGAVLVELGCGSANKTPRLLSAVARRLEKEEKEEKSEPSSSPSSSRHVVRYAGIDVSADFLDNARRNVTADGSVLPENVETFCLRYLEGARAARAAHGGEDLCFLWLGSSVGNLDAESAAAFVRELFAAAKGGDGDGDGDVDGDADDERKEKSKSKSKSKKAGKTQLLLCTDLWKDEGRLRAAYDDDAGVTAAFMRNGLRHALACVEVLAEEEGEGEKESTKTSTKTTALRVAASKGAAPAEWEYEVVVNPQDQQIEMYLVCPAPFELRIPKRKKEREEEKEEEEKEETAAAAAAAADADDVDADVADVVRFAEGERILMEVSRKYNLERIEQLARSSGVGLVGRWVTGDYGIQLLE